MLNDLTKSNFAPSRSVNGMDRPLSPRGVVGGFGGDFFEEFQVEE